MTDPKLDLSRVSREALEALAQACHEENEERAESARARIRAEATAPDHDADCYSLLGDGCDCGAEPAAEMHAQGNPPAAVIDVVREHYSLLDAVAHLSNAPAHLRPRIRAEATATLCYEGDCAKMTGRARPCPVHDAQPRRRAAARKETP